MRNRVHWNNCRCWLVGLTLLLTLPAVADSKESDGGQKNDDKPLQVFILAGQSNMQGHARVSTLEHIGMDPATEPMLKDMLDEKNRPLVCEDVWISYLSTDGEKHGRLSVGFGADTDKIGPEFTFGIYMQRKLDVPILIIKTAWGGKSLHTDFRPPSAGSYEFNQSQLDNYEKQGKDFAKIKSEKSQATGLYYKLMVEHVKKVLANIKRVYPEYNPDRGFELAGFVWFQGWNDMVDRGTYPQRDQAGGYDLYSKLMGQFIRDVRKDLDAPDLPFVIGVLGVNGPVDKYLPDQQRYRGIHQNFRSAMAAPADLPEFRGTVAAVLTENYWDQELVRLRAKEAKIKQQVKEMKTQENLSRQEEKNTLEKLRAESFSQRERKALDVGVSNAEYHYLGSAKILGGIGQGFANAMGEMVVD